MLGKSWRYQPAIKLDFIEMPSFDGLLDLY